MACKVCGGKSEKCFDAEILRKYNAGFYRCGDCGFLQAKDPSWLPEAYREPINVYDTGVLSRNLYLARLVSVVLYAFFGKRAKCLDYAGGYGLMTRMLRDIGYDCYWCDPNSENLFARGFEYGDSTGKIDLVTCFECFEHFAEPVAEIEKILEISGNILFTTTLLPQPVPASGDWWYYGFSHGQHISFYSMESLKHIARKHNLFFYTNRRDIHLFTEKRIIQGLFWALLCLSRIGFSFFIRAFMKSRTTEDMNILLSSRARR